MLKHQRKAFLSLVTCIALFSTVFCTVVPVKASAADTSSEKTADESVQNGWFTKDGKRYYRKNGKLLKNCWLTRKGERIAFLTKTGEAAVGKHTIGGTEYTFDENGMIIKDDRLSIEITDESLDNFTVTFTINENIKGKVFEYGEHFALERLTDGEWVRVPNRPTDTEGSEIVFLDIAYSKTSGTIVFTKDLNWYYGDNLTPGRYRFSTDMDIYEQGNDEGYLPQDELEERNKLRRSTFYAYFDIEEDE